MEHKRIALIGDVGGTNIRLELRNVDLDFTDPAGKIKFYTYKVADYEVFQKALEDFLSDLSPENYPSVAAIGIAGPISNNTVFMANAEKWGVLDGDRLGENLKIKNFVFANDFQAASYGVLTVQPDQFVSINGFQAQPKKVRAIMGPGTGLGNSVLYPIKQNQVIVIPSEGGHVDFPLIDDQVVEYFNFFKKEGNFSYISLERSFCGPSLPIMFKFYASKYPEEQGAKQATPTSQKIFELAAGQNPPLIYQKVLELFIKIYSSAIATFVVSHITVGGIYLVGSLTNTILHKIIGRDLLEGFKKRHPDVAKLVEKLPIVVCKEIQLGLRGAYFIALRTYNQNK